VRRVKETKKDRKEKTKRRQGWRGKTRSSRPLGTSKKDELKTQKKISKIKAKARRKREVTEKGGGKKE